jgi:hypothetical protein
MGLYEGLLPLLIFPANRIVLGCIAIRFGRFETLRYIFGKTDG